MEPVPFKGQNVVIAKDQPEYRQLPACYQGGIEGKVTSCWKFSIWDRIKFLFTGRLYLTQLTFGDKLQPQLPDLNWNEPICSRCNQPAGLHKEPTFICPVDPKIN